MPVVIIILINNHISYQDISEFTIQFVHCKMTAKTGMFNTIVPEKLFLMRLIITYCLPQDRLATFRV